MIDTFYSFETPEGVEIDLEIAGPIIRSYAYLIDASFRFGIQIVLALTLGILGKIGIAVMLISFFLLEWFYPVAFEVFRSGQTPGKKVMGIRAINDNGTPITWTSSVIRNLLMAVDFLPFMYITGIISMLLNNKFQRLGDIAAGTLVVYSDTSLKIPEISLETPKNFPIPLSLTEQQAIIGLAERRSLLSKDRIKELANILEGILEKEDEVAVKEIYRVANGFLGVK